jgi:hypothetical protein
MTTPSSRKPPALSTAVDPVRAFSHVNLATVLDTLLAKATTTATSALPDEEECREQD